MQPSHSAGADKIEHQELDNAGGTAEDGVAKRKSIIASRQPNHPLLGSRDGSTRTLTVIRPPSFSLATIVSGIRTLIGYRDFLYTLTLFRLAVRYKQSILGWIWALLQPLAMMLIYSLVFSRVARVKSEGVPYPLFVFSALLPWTFFSGAVSNAINGLVNYSTLITKLYFPKEIIPLSYVLAALVDLVIACCVLAGLMAYYRVSINWTILYALPVVLILIAFTSAVALFLSSIQVRFRDAAAALPLILQIGVFLTPVVYPVDLIPASFQRVYLLNPVASLVENFRRVVAHGSPPDILMLITSGAITFCCLLFAYAYFKARESTMSDVI
jgi:lipopolysaccharide transport system permease protein